MQSDLYDDINKKKQSTRTDILGVIGSPSVKLIFVVQCTVQCSVHYIIHYSVDFSVRYCYQGARRGSVPQYLNWLSQLL